MNHFKCFWRRLRKKLRRHDYIFTEARLLEFKQQRKGTITIYQYKKIECDLCGRQIMTEGINVSKAKIPWRQRFGCPGLSVEKLGEKIRLVATAENVEETGGIIDAQEHLMHGPPGHG